MAKGKCTKNQIATFDYLRKSTDDDKTCTACNGTRKRKGDTCQKCGGTGIVKSQERSIEQQRGELDRLPFPHELEREGFDGYAVASTHTDEGVSGWKLGDKRPGFAEMIRAIRAHDAPVKVIRVDNIDRFSRANIDDTSDVARELKQAGVRWIVAAAQGVFCIGNGNDLVEHMKFAFAAHASHEYSRQLSRRIALTYRNKAAAGKCYGGNVPYAMEDDGDGGLQPGDPDQVAVVRQMFEWFVGEHLSIRAIATRLNERGIPASNGGRWYTTTVKECLRRPAYAGTFVFGHHKGGQFYSTNADGEVAESDGRPSSTPTQPAFEKRGAWEAIVDPKVFDRAQRRLASFRDRRRKPRHDGYALSGGILVCDHCGGPMHGVQINKKKTTVYRCGTTHRAGRGACNCYQIAERDILPGVLQILGEEIDALQADTLLQSSRESEAAPVLDNARKIAALEKRIADWEDRILDVNKRTRQKLDAKITAAYDELDALRQAAEQPADDETESLEHLQQWWSKFTTSIAVPVDSPVAAAAYPSYATFLASLGVPGDTVDVDRRAINEALHELGCEVRLRWRSEKKVKRSRHYLDRGRFRLGQRVGVLAGSVPSRQLLRACSR